MGGKGSRREKEGREGREGGWCPDTCVFPLVSSILGWSKAAPSPLCHPRFFFYHHPLSPGSIMKLRNAVPTAPTRRPRHPAPLLPFLPFSRPTDKVTAVSGDNPVPFASRVCVSRLDAWLAGPDEERSPGQRSPSSPKSFIQPGIPT